VEASRASDVGLAEVANRVLLVERNVEVQRIEEVEEVAVKGSEDVGEKIEEKEEYSEPTPDSSPVRQT
jgi:hypothetical protein